jgi:hypothetical protein
MSRVRLARQSCRDIVFGLECNVVPAVAVAVAVSVLYDDVKRAAGADRLYRRSAFNCHCAIVDKK